MKHKKIFLGLENIAGIFTHLKKGFEDLGFETDFYSYRTHVFGYKTDKKILYSEKRFIRKFQKIFLLTKLLFKYDYFIFDSTGSLLPNFKDVRLFTKFGKKCAVIFTGCDLRLPDKVKIWKWNPCTNCTQEYKRLVGCVPETKHLITEKIENNFDYIFAPNEASTSLSKPHSDIFFPINTNEYELQFSNTKHRLKILHAPSNETYKGTKYIRDAIGKLQKEFDFDFEVVSGIQIEQLHKKIKEADLIIDQMLVGFYGLFTVEAMSFGKPVVCYIREDIWKKIAHDCPVYNSNPDNLYETLRSIILNQNELAGRGIQSRKYVEKYHEAKIVAENILNQMS